MCISVSFFKRYLYYDTNISSKYRVYENVVMHFKHNLIKQENYAFVEKPNG